MGNDSRLKKLRKEAGLRQYELAELLDISPSNLSKYEDAKQNLPNEVLIHLAKILNTTTDNILGLSKFNLFAIEQGLKNDFSLKTYLRNAIFESNIEFLISFKELPQEIIEEKIEQIIAVLHKNR